MIGFTYLRFMWFCDDFIVCCPCLVFLLLYGGLLFVYLLVGVLLGIAVYFVFVGFGCLFTVDIFSLGFYVGV